MPFFKKASCDAAGYHATVAAEQVRENEMTPVKVAGQKIILTRWQGMLLGFSALCPHAAADLTAGDLHRGRVTCPEHGYKFDVSNGRICYPPDETYRLRQYEVKEAEGLVWVRP